MTTRTRASNFSVLPGIEVECRFEKIDILKIPEIAEIVNAGRNAWPASEGTVLPLRTLFLTENPDGTFAALNELAPIRPELSRSSERNIYAAIVEFDPERQIQEMALRNCLSYVEPARFSLPMRKFLKAMFKGTFDDLAIIFGADRDDLAYHSAWDPLFPDGILARSTFYRLRLKALIGSATSKPAEEKLAETDEPETEPEPESEREPEAEAEATESDKDISQDPPLSLEDMAKPRNPDLSKSEDDDTGSGPKDNAQGDLFDE